MMSMSNLIQQRYTERVTYRAQSDFRCREPLHTHTHTSNAMHRSTELAPDIEKCLQNVVATSPQPATIQLHRKESEILAVSIWGRTKVASQHNGTTDESTNHVHKFAKRPGSTCCTRKTTSPPEDCFPFCSAALCNMAQGQQRCWACRYLCSRVRLAPLLKLQAAFASRRHSPLGKQGIHRFIQSHSVHALHYQRCHWGELKHSFRSCLSQAGPRDFEGILCTECAVGAREVATRGIISGACIWGKFHWSFARLWEQWPLMQTLALGVARKETTDNRP